MPRPLSRPTKSGDGRVIRNTGSDHGTTEDHVLDGIEEKIEFIRRKYHGLLLCVDTRWIPPLNRPFRTERRSHVLSSEQKRLGSPNFWIRYRQNCLQSFGDFSSHVLISSLISWKWPSLSNRTDSL